MDSFRVNTDSSKLTIAKRRSEGQQAVVQACSLIRYHIKSGIKQANIFRANKLYSGLQ